MARHRRHLDEIAAHLKAKATRQLSLEDLHPMKAFTARDGRMPSPWARNYWCPFTDALDDLRKAVRYVQRNPLKSGLPPQRWSCIEPFKALDS